MECLEDTQVGYTSKKKSFGPYTLEKYTPNQMAKMVWNEKFGFKGAANEKFGNLAPGGV